MSIFNENVSNVYLHNQMMRLMAFDFHGHHLITIRGFPRKNRFFRNFYWLYQFCYAALLINDSKINFGQQQSNGYYILLEFSQDKLIQIAY